jgi:putative membrane protein
VAQAGIQDRPLTVMAVVCLVALAWSAVNPADYATWFFELFLGIAYVLTLVALRKRFPFSTLVCLVAAIHFVVLAVGAKYTYAEVPLFNWLRDSFDLSRNHFDRVGHYMQGVTPALVMREVLLRKTKIGRNAWLTFSSVSVALAFSALYEILEWLWVAAFYPDQGPEWLGMQGDMFDAQADMLMAFLGGLTSAVVLARVHDASLRDLEGRVPQTHER